MRHPISDNSLQRFASGTSSREENRSIISHLARGCASCAAKVRSNIQPEVPADAYDAVFDRLSRTLQPAAKAAVLPFERRPALKPVPATPRAVRAHRR